MYSHFCPFFTADEGGVTEEQVNTGASESCCLEKEIILKLADIGLQVLFIVHLFWLSSLHLIGSVNWLKSVGFMIC